jgi:hypothetical protein
VLPPSVDFLGGLWVLTNVFGQNDPVPKFDALPKLSTYMGKILTFTISYGYQPPRVYVYI